MSGNPDISVFTDKASVPSEEDVRNALGHTHVLWEALREFVRGAYPLVLEEWNHAGKNYGWSFRMKDKKRVLVYFLPRNGFFKIAMVFGRKATDAVMESAVSGAIRNELAAAKVYAEGRGIRIDVRKEEDLHDIRQLISIKLSH